MARSEHGIWENPVRNPDNACRLPPPEDVAGILYLLRVRRIAVPRTAPKHAPLRVPAKHLRNLTARKPSLKIKGKGTVHIRRRN